MKIFLATHKKYTFPEDTALYIPLQCGADIDEPLGYLPDNIGDNISKKNRNYCELTAYYWVWKNVLHDDIVGVGHYRRIPVDCNGNKFYTQSDLREIFSEYDALIAGNLNYDPQKHFYTDDHHIESALPKDSTYSQYASTHHRVDMDLAWEAIHAYLPDYEEEFIDYIIFGKLFIPCNILVAKKEVFDGFCEWLFKILFFVEKHSPYETYDDYNKRAFGFLAERLFALYFIHNNLKCKSCSTIDLEEDADMHGE